MSEKMIKPLGDRVVVEPDAATEKTSGGIIIPDTAKEKPQTGKIIACGPGTPEEKIRVSEGDHVLYPKHVGSKIDIDGKEYLIMRDKDLWAVL